MSQEAPRKNAKAPARQSLLNQMEENLTPENQTDAGESFSYILDRILSDPDTENRIETLRELLAHPKIFKHACYRLLSFGVGGQQTAYQKVLTLQLWSALRNKDIPLIRLFAIQFIPILIWFHLSRQRAQFLPGVAACLAGLHKFEMSKDEKGEEKIDSKYEDEGAGGSYTLFPKVECPDIFQKDSVYHETTELKRRVNSRTGGESKNNAPAVKSKNQSTTIVICQTALQLYIYFISRVCDASMRHFLLVVGLLCSGGMQTPRETEIPILQGPVEELLWKPSSKFDLEEDIMMQLLQGIIYIREQNKFPNLVNWALEQCFKKAHADIYPLAILTIQTLLSSTLSPIISQQRF